MQDYEKLGVFYLGRRFDLDEKTTLDEPILYDSRNLTTHAVCLGMTGSGKTGLCLTLLEEAAIDGIPAIAIDPKGDLGNLMLTFPGLRPEDFRPWIDEGEAVRAGLDPDAHAAQVAERWRKGLAAWDQEPERIARFRSAVDVAIYTPGSSAGLPISVLRSLAAPPSGADPEELRERTLGTVSALLGLLRIEADPIRSREHVLLAKLVELAWSEGRDVELSTLVREIQSPKIDRVGARDLESFFPAKDRSALALALNNLLASPGFSAWLDGEALDVGRLLWTEEGKPRLSILSIAHLSDAERMFFVSLLLEEVRAWMRRQSGTSSLRAILYMDEVAGFFPPVAAPPSKAPMLSLLKQARAFGLGVVLATQNPVDIDYKGLSNAGTWFLGRLQTERDKARVLEGLEGASAAAGRELDRARMDKILSGLGQRVFLMNDVHGDGPVVFQSRWALSYLRGPLTRVQIQKLMADRRAAAGPSTGSAGARADEAPAGYEPSGAGRAVAAGMERPLLPHDVKESFAAVVRPRPAGARLVYRPAACAGARLHYLEAKGGIDLWQDTVSIALLDAGTDEPDWDAAERPESRPDCESEPREQAAFAPLPGAASRAKSYAVWQKTLADNLYRTRVLELPWCPSLETWAKPGENRRDFQIRMNQVGHERRDAEVDKIRQKFAARIERARDAVTRADSRVEQRGAELTQRKAESWISVGAGLLNFVVGGPRLSATNVGRATAAARSIQRANQKRDQIDVAASEKATQEERLLELQRDVDLAIDQIELEWDTPRLELARITPRKTDVSVETPILVWLPAWEREDGSTEPAWK